jgi:putative FmdB family regulatory protein
MPLYEYECEAGHHFEKILKFSDPPLETCPTCGKPVHKLVSSPAIQFKGTGWYITDYAKKDTKDTKETKDAKESSGSSEKKEAKDSKDSKDSSTKETPAAKTSDTSSSTTTPAAPASKDSSKAT